MIPHPPHDLMTQPHRSVFGVERSYFLQEIGLVTPPLLKEVNMLLTSNPIVI